MKFLISIALFEFLISIALFVQPVAPAKDYTDLEEVASKSGNNTELTETYRSCLAKGELLVCKINHDQISRAKRLTKVRLNFLLRRLMVQ